MWLNIIAIIIAALSLIGLISLVARHLRSLIGLDVDQVPGIQPARLKQSLLEQRLQRQINNVSKPVIEKVHGTAKTIYQWAHNNSEKLILLEESYRRKLLGKPLTDVLARQQQKQNMLSEAEVLTEQEKYTEAEQVYLKLLSLEPTSIEAYEGLGTLYYRKRDYEEARQTFEHLAKLHGGGEAGYGGLGLVAAERGDLRAAASAYQHSLIINPKAVSVHYNFTKVYESMDNLPKAINHINLALSLEPENPRYLDYGINLAILQRDAVMAEQLVERLAATNPDNQKLPQYRQAIQDLDQS